MALAGTGPAQGDAMTLKELPPTITVEQAGEVLGIGHDTGLEVSSDLWITSI